MQGLITSRSVCSTIQADGWTVWPGHVVDSMACKPQQLTGAVHPQGSQLHSRSMIDYNGLHASGLYDSN